MRQPLERAVKPDLNHRSGREGAFEKSAAEGSTSTDAVLEKRMNLLRPLRETRGCVRSTSRTLGDDGAKKLLIGST